MPPLFDKANDKMSIIDKTEAVGSRYETIKPYPKKLSKSGKRIDKTKQNA